MRIIRERTADFARRAWKDAVKPDGFVRGNPTFVVTIDSQYNVTMYMGTEHRKAWNCTCVHGSMYGVNKVNETCKHIKMVCEAIKHHKTIQW